MNAQQDTPKVKTMEGINRASMYRGMVKTIQRRYMQTMNRNRKIQENHKQTQINSKIWKNFKLVVKISQMTFKAFIQIPSKIIYNKKKSYKII
ncbi:UNKNOWN [Stylonychia lemnae]|uniref:Uncharacterized protein n=1 Tax=Stylonychia lemnae TaxID=5949 RepID=A0A077ZY85_STYLE|nr:UNKNOWN [Stylonychia lemnae]|eukprot:CDW74602.1 UNKNOWN [Stylonychia lemnae]